MKKAWLALLVTFGLTCASAQTTVTIASVNNPDMVTMQELSSNFTEQNPDIALEWLFLDEGTLRSRLTTDVATGSGSFDLVTVGAYEVPLWAANDWIVSIDQLSEDYPNVMGDYNVDDLLPAVTDMLTYEDELYAAPFYGESSFTMYNQGIFEEAGLTMPEATDLAGDSRLRLSASRPAKRRLRHRAARQARLGRQHGSDYDGREYLWRTVV